MIVTMEMGVGVWEGCRRKRRSECESDGEGEIAAKGGGCEDSETQSGSRLSRRGIWRGCVRECVSRRVTVFGVLKRKAYKFAEKKGIFFKFTFLQTV